MKGHKKLQAVVIALALGFGSSRLHGATNAISAGETASAVLAVGQTNFYSFAAASNDVVSLFLANGVNYSYPTLELQRPDGTVIATVSDNVVCDDSYIDALRLTNAGTFLVLVRDDNGLQTYAYGLTLIKNPGPNASDDGGTIQPGQTVTNSLT